MPKPAACNINGEEGNVARVFVCECVCAHIDQAYLAGGFLQLSHSVLLRRNRPGPKTQRLLQQH